MKTTDQYLQRGGVNLETRSVVGFLALITFSYGYGRNATYHNVLTRFSRHIMAARFVAWTSRILRRGGSPGAVSSFYLSAYRTVNCSTHLSQRLTTARANTRGSQFIARARTRIVRFKIEPECPREGGRPRGRCTVASCRAFLRKLRTLR